MSIAPSYPSGYPKALPDEYELMCQYCGHSKDLAYVRPGTIACLDWKACDERSAKQSDELVGDRAMIKVTTKTGSCFEAEEYYEDIVAKMQYPKKHMVIEFTSLSGGLPKPKLTVATDQIESVQQVNR
jgi:hypothetical protein